MSQPQQLMRNKSVSTLPMRFYKKFKRAFFPLIVFCIGTFFMQEEDETMMYIILFVIVIIVGIVNVVRSLFSKHKKKGKDGHGHTGPEEHGSNEGAE